MSLLSRAATGAVCFVAIAGAACAGDGSTSSSGSTDSAETTSGPETTSTAVAQSPFSAGDQYVALGSSIASGFGIPEQSTSCGRSSRSYPNLVASRYGLELTDVSCGAAVVPNLIDVPQVDNPPQIDAVGSETKLVTISVGGNDIGYNVTALACGDPTTTCNAPTDVESRVAEAQAALEELIDELGRVAPDATIVLVTYPREVPPGNCAAMSFTDDEAAIVRSLGQRLEDYLVEVASTTGVLLVDPYTQPGDHTGCAPESDRWTAGFDAPDGTPYHPTALGHEVMADLIIAQLDSEIGS